jgi:hypothetical protein
VQAIWSTPCSARCYLAAHRSDRRWPAISRISNSWASGRRGEQPLQASALSFGPANTDSWFRERFDPSNTSGPIIGLPACFLHLWNQLKCLLPRQSRTRGTGPDHSGACRVSIGTLCGSFSGGPTPRQSRFFPPCTVNLCQSTASLLDGRFHSISLPARLLMLGQ